MATLAKLVIGIDADTGKAVAKFVDLSGQADQSANKIKNAFGKVDFAEARGGMMLFDDLIGVKLPRHVTSFISSLGPIGAAMEAAFPFLAIAVGAVVLIEHLTKLKEAAEKLDADTAKFETTVHTTFNTLDDKLIEAGKKADELRGDHIAALSKELTLIDHASMKELMQTFDNLAKAVDAVFADMKSHWYTFGSGAEGAKHSLESFKAEYDLLLSKGDEDGAAKLLKNKMDREKQMLADMRASLEYEANAGKGGGTEEKANAYMEARTRLAQAGAGYAKDEVTAEAKLVEVLQAQAEAQQKIAALKKQEKDNAKQGESNRQGNEAFRRMKEEERQQAEEDRRREEAYRQAVEHIQEGEREKVAATKEGTAERLAAIDAAIKEENNKGLQETNYYKQLVLLRIATIREMSEEEARARAEAGKIAAAHGTKMAELQTVAEMQELKHRQAMRHKFSEQDIADAIEIENKEAQIKRAALEKQIAALDKNDRDYQNKLKALHNKEEEEEKQHQNKLTDIKEKAEEERNKRILAAERQFEDAIASGLSNVLMRHESFGQMMSQLGDQVAAGLLKNALMSMMTADMTKEKDAAYAARKAWNAGMDFPFPINIAMAPVLAAGAFASVMAFNQGGLVPGSGNDDIVPALLTPGERVFTVDENKQLTRAATAPWEGSMGGPMHVNYAPHYHGQYNEAEHQRRFDRSMKDMARKRGMRWN